MMTSAQAVDHQVRFADTVQRLCGHVERLGAIVERQASEIDGLRAQLAALPELRKRADIAAAKAEHVGQLLEVLTAKVDALPARGAVRTKIEHDEKGRIVGLVKED